MQLLNPTFCDKVRVYNDPFIKESTSLGVAGIDVVGGNEKSYYVQVEGSKAAFRLYKKDYRKEFVGLWQKCPDMKTKFPDMNRVGFNKNIIYYNTCAK